MTTPRSLSLILAFSLGGCATSASQSSAAQPEPVASAPPAAMGSAALEKAEPEAPEGSEPEHVETVGLAPAPAPLTASQRELFFASPEDPAAEFLGGVTKAQEGRHYVAGNEKALHVFRPRIDGIGGGYVGVGSDQAYLFIGWARSELAWLIDYDPVVLDVHACHHAFFAAAASPEDYLALWSKEGREQALAVLGHRYEGEQATRVIAVYKRYRGWIDRRLQGLHKRYTKLEVATFVTDQATYEFVRDSVANGRVRPMLANLLERGAIEAIGDTARELGVPIRLLYLSNAEEYWKGFPEAYRHNMRALHFDEHSVVMHTLLTWAENQDYRYAVQSAFNYREWLDRPWFQSVYQMFPKPIRKPESEPFPPALIESDEDPDSSRAAQRAANRGATGVGQK